MAKKIKPLPKFKSLDEEAKFWDAHSFLDYSYPIDIDTPLYINSEESKVTMTIRVTPEFRKAVKRLAKDSELSASSLVRMWAVEGLKKMRKN